jgi:hypothetical protein
MTTYVVDAYDSKEKVWKTVLSTKDRAEAEAMKEAMEQDGVRARIEDVSAEEALGLAVWGEPSQLRSTFLRNVPNIHRDRPAEQAFVSVAHPSSPIIILLTKTA